MGQLCYLIGLGKPNTSGANILFWGRSQHTPEESLPSPSFSACHLLNPTTLNLIFKLPRSTILTCNPLHHTEASRNFFFSFILLCSLLDSHLTEWIFYSHSSAHFYNFATCVHMQTISFSLLFWLFKFLPFITITT